jgi:alpha-beta hydrolase superfamily lysophospholipase
MTEALSDELERVEASVHLVVIGGGGLIAMEVVDRTTRDFDAVALEQDGQLVSSPALA